MNNESADVRSIDALRDWLAALAKYRSAVQDTLSGMQMEIRKAHDWLESQGQLWKTIVRDCEDELLRAKNELRQRKYSTDLSGREPDTTVQERNLRRAEARLEFAQEKVETCRRWVMKLPKVVEESYDGAARRLANFTDVDLQNAMALLDRQITALENYAGLRRDFTTPR
jgi:HEPN domain-containing protein